MKEFALNYPGYTFMIVVTALLSVAEIVKAFAH